MSTAGRDVIRRELRRVTPDVKVDAEQVKEVLVNEIIQREVMEGEKADEARKKIARALNKPLRVVPLKAEPAAATNELTQTVSNDAPSAAPAHNDE